MKRQFIFFGMMAALVCGVGAARAQESTPAPTYKEGDTWRINIARQGQVVSTTNQAEGLYEIVFTQGEAKVYKLDGERRIEVDTAAETPGEGLLGMIGKNERRPDLKFPLTIGQKWTYQLTVRPAGARQDQRRSAEVTVVGQEQVTTPAGTFNAYKLVRSESWSVGRAGGVNTSTSTFFYSPETQSIVKRVTENSNNPATMTNELVKFTPGGMSPMTETVAAGTGY